MASCKSRQPLELRSLVVDFGSLFSPATGCAAMRFGAMLFAGLALLAGCDRGPEMAPVRGQVLYRNRPLEFGNVMFQPPSGQPASGDIQPDGTFSLSTYEVGDGAVVGRHKVRITCYEFQRPGAEQKESPMPTFGELFIPKKYIAFHSSGLEVDVEVGMPDPLVFELSDE